MAVIFVIALVAIFYMLMAILEELKKDKYKYKDFEDYNERGNLYPHNTRNAFYAGREKE